MRRPGAPPARKGSYNALVVLICFSAGLFGGYLILSSPRVVRAEPGLCNWPGSFCSRSYAEQHRGSAQADHTVAGSEVTSTGGPSCAHPSTPGCPAKHNSCFWQAILPHTLPRLTTFHAQDALRGYRRCAALLLCPPRVRCPATSKVSPLSCVLAPPRTVLSYCTELRARPTSYCTELLY
jgi:hypothetical protein